MTSDSLDRCHRQCKSHIDTVRGLHYRQMVPSSTPVQSIKLNKFTNNYRAKKPQETYRKTFDCCASLMLERRHSSDHYWHPDTAVYESLVNKRATVTNENIDRWPHMWCKQFHRPITIFRPKISPFLKIYLHFFVSYFINLRNASPIFTVRNVCGVVKRITWRESSQRSSLANTSSGILFWMWK